MNIIHTLSLSQEQTNAIHLITELCRQSDNHSLSCPDDGDEFWLLYDACGEMNAFLAVYRMDEASWECSAFTRPDRRRLGYFSALLEQVCSDSQAQGEPDLYFVADKKCRDTCIVLEHIGAQFLYDEYMMETEPGADDGRAKWESGKDSVRSLCITSEYDEHEKTLTIYAWLPDSEGSASAPIGTCRITFQQDSAYLYALKIAPAHRGQGLGTHFLLCVLSRLREQGCARLRLQVSGANEPALRLYKKTGFHITETLSCYLY